MCEYCVKHFGVFQKSRVKGSGKFSKKHFDAWGWVNFLKTIAKAKVFDIPGSNMNSIDCAREAKCFDVLIYATEEKELAEARQLDHEIDIKKQNK